MTEPISDTITKLKAISDSLVEATDTFEEALHSVIVARDNIDELIKKLQEKE